MPISFMCQHCGEKLKAPARAAGKSSTCPRCGGLVTCPEPVYEAELVELALEPTPQVNPYADLGDSKPYALAGSPVEGPDAAQNRRPCPMCGEMIVSTAAKCRFCGEVFDKVLQRATVKTAKKSSSRTTKSSAESGSREILVGFVLFILGVGITVLSFANAQRNGKASGRFYITYGLIIMGIIGMIRGFKNHMASGR